MWIKLTVVRSDDKNDTGPSIPDVFPIFALLDSPLIYPLEINAPRLLQRTRNR